VALFDFRHDNIHHHITYRAKKKTSVIFFVSLCTVLRFTHSLRLSIQTLGSGSTSVNSKSFENGSQVSIMAKAMWKWEFKRWELDGVDIGSVNPIIVSMDNDHTIKAVFTEITSSFLIKYKLTVKILGSGTTSVGNRTVDNGVRIGVTATAESG
jgi:hypothetical protein